VRYRVEQLAAACDVSVDTVRYYQARGLVPQPERQGRVAWYGPEHVERIRRIRDLQGKGLTLAAIGRVLRGELAASDADLAAAVAEAKGTADDETTLSVDRFAEVSGVPASLIQAVEREGIGIGRTLDGETRYDQADVEVVRTALRLLEHGLPLADLLALGREADTALRSIADRAVELVDEHVRRPIRDTAGEGPEAALQMVQAFQELLPAVTTLVSHHFRRVLLQAAESKIERPDQVAT
jgi:DNA-binding transcriptional MerR regulator